jgi:hypothetical protein
MNKLIIIINEFYKRTHIINKMKNFLFYNDFDFLRFYADFYISLNNKIEIFNSFNLKFTFSNI